MSSPPHITPPTGTSYRPPSRPTIRPTIRETPPPIDRPPSPSKAYTSSDEIRPMTPVPSTPRPTPKASRPTNKTKKKQNKLGDAARFLLNTDDAGEPDQNDPTGASFNTDWSTMAGNLFS